MSGPTVDLASSTGFTDLMQLSEQITTPSMRSLRLRSLLRCSHIIWNTWLCSSRLYVQVTTPSMIPSLMFRSLKCMSAKMKYCVRMITAGALGTFSRVQNTINILQGPAGMDENQVHLFKDAAAIDRVWKNQQKHLDCLQDPPGKDKHITRNGMCLPHYSKVRGINTLEGFHSFLPSMIPGPHCAAVPFQVYLLSGITCRKSDRESGGFKSQKGRKHMVYVSPLIDRLKQSCQDLFGEVEEANYRPPVPAQDKQIGL